MLTLHEECSTRASRRARDSRRRPAAPTGAQRSRRRAPPTTRRSSSCRALSSAPRRQQAQQHRPRPPSRREARSPPAPATRCTTSTRRLEEEEAVVAVATGLASNKSCRRWRTRPRICSATRLSISSSGSQASIPTARCSTRRCAVEHNILHSSAHQLLFHVWGKEFASYKSLTRSSF